MPHAAPLALPFALQEGERRRKFTHPHENSGQRSLTLNARRAGFSWSSDPNTPLRWTSVVDTPTPNNFNLGPFSAREHFNRIRHLTVSQSKRFPSTALWKIRALRERWEWSGSRIIDRLNQHCTVQGIPPLYNLDGGIQVTHKGIGTKAVNNPR
jgi:hypothetical protein